MTNRNPSLRIPPQHLESEKALLGSIMLKPDSIYEIVDTITADSFYTEKHRMIYKAMLELNEKSDAIDLLTLSTKLEDKKQLDRAGGKTYLAELISTVPSASNIKHYADIVQKKYIMRSLINAGDHISEIGYTEDSEVEEILDAAERKIYSVTHFGRPQSVVSIKESLVEAWDRIDKLSKSTETIRGVPTGFKKLDDMLAGFQKSDLIILAARPSMGKTSLALDIVRRSALNNDIPIGVFSLEMSAQQLIDRMLSAESKVDSWKLRTGKLSNDADFEHIRDGLDRLSKAPIFINDQPSMNILSIRSAARKLKSEHGLGLIVVDYLQLMVPVRSSDSMVQQVTEISRSLKNLARELDVPVLALSQLSRAVEQRGGRPRLSDLRDSGSIEQDADVVMFIHREDKYQEQNERTNIAELLVEKHRNGPTGKVELYFDEKKTTFLDRDNEHEESYSSFDQIF